MPNKNEERLAVMQAYDSKKWHTRVRAMDDGQVHAIYLRLKLQGKIK